MKRKIICLLIIPFILTGCFNKEGAVDKFIKKVNNSKKYYLTGDLEIVNNENIYKYKVKVSYKAKDQFKVSMLNKTNDHEQIILRNKDSVYVVTPSLNKSFKFQSDWPYNNSGSYLLQSLVTDIKNSKKKKITHQNNYTVVTVDVNYSNNNKLKKGKIYLKNNMVKKVEVLDKDGNIKIKMKFKNIDFSPKFSKDYFNLNNNLSETSTETTGKIDEITYPMYLPDNTYLASEDKVSGSNRTILTFLGEKPFTIVQEPATVSKELETINMNGEPEILLDTIGSLSDNEISWISNGVEYYATSKTLEESELLEVVNSMSTMPVSK